MFTMFTKCFKTFLPHISDEIKSAEKYILSILQKFHPIQRFRPILKIQVNCMFIMLMYTLGELVLGAQPLDTYFILVNILNA